MDTLGTLISWMTEAIRGVPASLSDPKARVVIFAVPLLVLLYWIASSIRRLRRQIAHLSSELQAIRSILKKIEWALGRIEEKKSSADKDRKTIFTLPLRENQDRTEWK